MSQRAESGYVSFILIGAAAITMIYWVKVIKKMAIEQKPVTFNQGREQEIIRDFLLVLIFVVNIYQ